MAAPDGINQSPAQGVYRSIIDSQYRLYEHLDERFQALARLIMETAVEIAGDWVAENRRANREVTPETALAEVRSRVSRYVVAYEDIARVEDLHQKLIAITLQFQNMHGEFNRIRSERDRLAQELQELQKARGAAREGKNNKSATQEPPPPPVSSWTAPEPARVREPEPPAAAQALQAEHKPVVNAPAWYLEWAAASQRAKRYAWDATLLQVIGETGMSERQTIAEEARRRQRVSANNKKPMETLNRLAEDGFLTVRDAESGAVGGRPPKLYQLTEKGQAAYVFLTSNRPLASELETKAIHKSDAHTLLIARTVRLLQSADFEIRAQGERLELAGGHLFQPDITAVHSQSGEVIYVEVEMDANKGDWQAREQKWQNCWAATGGNIFLVAENRKSELRLLSEIRSALPRKAYRIRSFNHEEGPATDGSIWTRG